MIQEELFLKNLKSLVFLANRQGKVVSEEQIKEVFEETILDIDKMNAIKEYLKANKIGVGEKLVEEAKEETLDEVSGIQEGDLVTRLMPMVVEIANLYTGQGVYVEDLIGEGNLALIVSKDVLEYCDDYNEASEMASKIIMSAMEECIMANFDAAEVDRFIVEKVNEIATKVDELYEVYQRKITIEEVVKELDYTKEEIDEWIFVSGCKIERLEC